MNEYDYISKASKKYSDEKYHEVIKLCGKALEINDKLPDAYNYMGSAKYELKEYEGSVDAFTFAISLEPDVARHYHSRAWAYIQLNQFDNAMVDMNKAVALEPSAQYYFERAKFEFNIGRCKEALADYTSAIELEPTASKYIKRADAYFELEMFDLAMADYNQAIDMDPESNPAFRGRGLLKMELDLWGEAIKDFKQAMEINPGDDKSCIRMGMCKVFLGRKDAMKYFNKAVKINPCAENYYHRVIARGRIIQRQEALKDLALNKQIDISYDLNKVFSEKQAKDDIADLNKAIPMAAGDVDFYEMRAARYSYLKDYTNAALDCSILKKLQPNNPGYYLAYAQNEYAGGCYEETVRNLDIFIKMTGGFNHEQISFIRGMSNYKLGRYQDAVQDFTNGINLNETPGLYYYRGMVNFRLMRLKKAYEDFRKAVELDSDIEEKSEEKIPLPIKFFIKNDKPENLVGLAGLKMERNI